MATRQNLIDTYNANPTLQARYTLPQYLSLFDFSQTTTPTQTPTTTQPAGTGFANVLNSLSGFIGSTSNAISNTQLPQVQVEAKPDKNTNMILIGIAGLLAFVLLKK